MRLIERLAFIIVLFATASLTEDMRSVGIPLVKLAYMPSIPDYSSLPERSVWFVVKGETFLEFALPRLLLFTIDAAGNCEQGNLTCLNLT